MNVHVVGTAARLEGEILSGSVTLWRRGESEPVDVSPDRAPGARIYGYPGSLELVRDWIGRIRGGGEADAGIAPALAATAVSAAAERSLRTGEPVRITL